MKKQTRKNIKKNNQRKITTRMRGGEGKKPYNFILSNNNKDLLFKDGNITLNKIDEHIHPHLRITDIVCDDSYCKVNLKGEILILIEALGDYLTPRATLNNEMSDYLPSHEINGITYSRGEILESTNTIGKYYILVGFKPDSSYDDKHNPFYFMNHIDYDKYLENPNNYSNFVINTTFTSSTIRNLGKTHIKVGTRK